MEEKVCLGFVWVLYGPMGGHPFGVARDRKQTSEEPKGQPRHRPLECWVLVESWITRIKFE